MLLCHTVMCTPARPHLRARSAPQTPRPCRAPGAHAAVASKAGCSSERRCNGVVGTALQRIAKGQAAEAVGRPRRLVMATAAHLHSLPYSLHGVHAWQHAGASNGSRSPQDGNHGMVLGLMLMCLSRHIGQPACRCGVGSQVRTPSSRVQVLSGRVRQQRVCAWACLVSHPILAQFDACGHTRCCGGLMLALDEPATAGACTSLCTRPPRDLM